MPRLTTFATLLFVLAGCSSNSGNPDVTADGSNSALTAADLDRFLSVVKCHEAAMIPEFTPPDEDPSLDLDAPAKELVTAFQNQCHRLFDAERQGKIWQRDTEWKQALAGSNISPRQFAALVRDVSLAIMRVRLEARVDLGQLVARAGRQVDHAVGIIEEIDEVPAEARTRAAVALRTRSVIRLGQSVALREFAEFIRRVPPDSAAAVRRYSRQLKPLLPASINDELLAELKKLATAPDGEVLPANYEEPDEE
jgi:hypothetical protein